MPTTIAMYADLVCPWAYLTAWRLRQARERLGAEVRIAHKSLSLEYVNSGPSPRRWLAMELPLLMCEEADIPWQMWSRPEFEWPVTVMPAFEAVKCAERQSMALADELDWALRTAFHGQSRTMSLRHEILTCAAAAGLDMDRFTTDFDSGVAKALVIEEAKEGWERLKVNGSPTLVFPNGRQLNGRELALPAITFGENRVLGYTPGAPEGTSAVDLLVQVIEESLSA